MSEEKYEQLELDFEGEKEVENNKVVDANFVEVEESNEPNPAVEVQAQLVISLKNDGSLDVSVPEGMPELKPADVEELARRVYEQLRDMRVAQVAVEIFKQRLVG